MMVEGGRGRKRARGKEQAGMAKNEKESRQSSWI